MTKSSTLWRILKRYVPKRKWVSTQEIFSIIETHSTLDREDLAVNNSKMLRWKLNVRRLLNQKKKEGTLRGRTRE